VEAESLMGTNMDKALSLYGQAVLIYEYGF